jgi:hypothetical protein
MGIYGRLVAALSIAASSKAVKAGEHAAGLWDFVENAG